MTFAATPEPGDQPIEGSGLRAFVAPDVAKVLVDTTIETRADDDGTVLVVRRRTDPT